MAKKVTKASLILEMLNKGMTGADIRKRMKVSSSYISTLKKQMAHRAEEPKPGEYIVVEGAKSPQEIDAILNARGSRYGKFSEHARITQNIKRAMEDSPNWELLPMDTREALEMVAHKIGRMLNGDPEYVDNVIDIIGYMQLVLDRMNGKAERGISA